MEFIQQEATAIETDVADDILGRRCVGDGIMTLDHDREELNSIETPK